MILKTLKKLIDKNINLQNSKKSIHKTIKKYDNKMNQATQKFDLLSY